MSAGDNFLNQALGFLKETGTSVFCFSETEPDWNQQEVILRLHRQIKLGFQNSCIAVSSSGVPETLIHQLGGMCMGELGNWSGRVSAT